MIFSVVTEFCSHHNSLILEHVHNTPKNPCTPDQSYPSFLPPLKNSFHPTLGSHSSDSHPMDLPILDILCKWNHTVFGEEVGLVTGFLNLA